MNTIKSSFQNHITFSVINELTDFITDRMYELQGKSVLVDFKELIEKKEERNEVTG